MKFRLDQDSLGKVKIPADAYYGAFTGRALINIMLQEIKPIVI